MPSCPDRDTAGLTMTASGKRGEECQMPVTLPFDLTITDGVAVMQGQAVMDRRDWQVGAGYADESTVGFQVDLTVALTATR